MGQDKLANKLMDAYMIGDKELIDNIKSEINDRFEKSRPQKLTSTIVINTVLNNDEAPASIVYDFLNKAFGEDWWEWEIETIDRMLWLKYALVLEPINRDKVLAIRHVCRSDGAFSDWFEFNQVALSFSGCMADFEQLRSPSSGMAISAVHTLNHIRPDRNSFFSNDVLKYISIILKNDGIYVPPPSLFELLKGHMEEEVSQEVKEKWKDIYINYQKILENNPAEFSENMINIQARRILKAETSAAKYGA